MPIVPVFPDVAPTPPGPPTGTIQWVKVAEYNYRNVATSAAVTGPGTVPSGVAGLPDLTFATDNAGTYSATPTNGTGIVLSNTGTGRPYVHFTPNWAGLGINLLDPESFAVGLQLGSPVQAASSFFTFMLATGANPNGSVSGNGGRCLNTAGTRNIIARSTSAGTAELGATIFSSATDFTNISFLGGALPGETVGSGIYTTMPASPAGWTQYRDGFTRTLGTTAGLSPGVVTLLWGGANISANYEVVTIWQRRVV
jgi:hypothetical protein